MQVEIAVHGNGVIGDMAVVVKGEIVVRRSNWRVGCIGVVVQEEIVVVVAQQERWLWSEEVMVNWEFVVVVHGIVDSDLTPRSLGYFWIF